MLTSWRLPPMPYAGPITLRMLLAHRAGTNVPGFPGYRLDEPLPELPRILDGVPGTNEPIRVAAEPGAQPSYSGGAYVLETAHTGSFAVLVAGASLLTIVWLVLVAWGLLRAQWADNQQQGYGHPASA
jgi:hypothetical protein